MPHRPPLHRNGLHAHQLFACRPAAGLRVHALDDGHHMAARFTHRFDALVDVIVSFVDAIRLKRYAT